METKKKNFLDNLRVRAKLSNLKKGGKKTPNKQGKKLAHRRSISVPDLRFVPGEASPAQSPAPSAVTDGIYFGISAGISDTDSIASSSTNDVAFFTEKLTVPGLESTRLPTDSAALNRVSAPAGTFMLPEDMEQNNSAWDGKMNLPAEAFYAQVDKKAKKRGQKFLFEPIPVPRRNALIPRLEPEERESLSGDGSSEDFPSERVVSGPLAAALARAGSQAEQAGPGPDQRGAASFEQARPPAPAARGTPPAGRQSAEKPSLKLDALGSPVESADGASLDSACGTPNEDLLSMSWAADWDGLDQETSPYIIKDEEVGMPEEISELSNEPYDLYLDDSLQDPFENSATAPGAEFQMPVVVQRYLLCITLKQGRNLVIRDKRAGTSDPYVKFKLDGKQFHRSKVVYKSLHPRWNESFTHPLRDREHVVEVRVYDKNRTTDDFMGSSSIPLKDLDLFKTYEIELHLQDPKSKEDDMGVICVDVCLMYRDATIKKPPKWPQKKNKQKAAQSPRPAEAQRNQQRNQVWSRVLAVTLVEGQDLPQYGHGDVYVRFRLGEQKYKSKNLCIQANPQWREQFDFNHFEDNQEPLQVEVYSKRGRKGEESWGMFEIDLSKLEVNERKLYTHPLGSGKGRLVFLVTLKPCCGVSISDMEVATLEKSDDRNAVMEKFSLKNSYKCVGDVGFLQVKVVKANELPATDLNGKSNPLCVIELGTGKLQTHTIYRTVNPEWNKAFTFPVKDIHDVVELTVLDENGDKAPTFLGKVAVPLLSIQNEQQVCLFLKKENLSCVSKGTITLELEVIYNKVRAGIKTFQPKDAKLTEENLKFSKKVLARNIYRVRKISTAVLYTLQYIKSCFQWESTQRSLIAFLIFLLTVWHWELFMLPLFLLLLIGWNYFHLSTGKASANQDLVNMSIGDDEEEDEKEASKKGLMDKIHMVQEVVLAVQAVLEELANIGERMKNIFNWSVPFLSCLACIVLFTATALLYLIPLRYIVLIWGVNKFTKKLRNPYAIDNNEILDFLQRVPSDVQKVQYSAARAPTIQNQQRKKK